MKTTIVFVLFAILTCFAQDASYRSTFSTFNIGIYGGGNFDKTSDIYITYYAEASTNITKDINITFALGYYKIVDNKSIKIKTYRDVKINGFYKYNTISYSVSSVEYRIVPIQIGLQYIFNFNFIKPYLYLNGSHNFIDPLTKKNAEIVEGTYEKFEDIPKEFSSKNILKNSSYTLGIGFGSQLTLTKEIYLDIRYNYLIDESLLNTHQVLVGVGIKIK